MAGIRRYGSTYHLDFRYHGKRYQRSIETTDEGEALRLKAILEDSLLLLKRGVLQIQERPSVDELFRFLLSGGRQSVHTEVRQEVTLGELCAAYVESHSEDEKETSTLKTETIHLNHFQRLLGRRVSVLEICVEKLTDYVRTRRTEKGIRGRTIQPTTVTKELQTFAQLWAFGVDRELITGECPATKIKKPRRNQKPPFMAWEEIETRVNRGGLEPADVAELWDCLFLRETEIAAFLKHVTEEVKKFPAYPYLFPAIAFCAYTGARRSEMFRCLIDDVSQSILIREKKRQRDRRITFREVPLHGELRTILDSWLAVHPGGQILFCKNSGKPLDDKTSRDAFKSVARESKWKVLRGYHVLRHSFASNLARHGVDQYKIDELMGHQTEEMRQRYRHLFPEDRRQAISMLSYSE